MQIHMPMLAKWICVNVRYVITWVGQNIENLPAMPGITYSKLRQTVEFPSHYLLH